MGNSSSASSGQTLTQEQKDIRHLGDRMPFGDAELRRLYRLYYEIEQSSERTSFLHDWAVHAVQGDDEKKREERAVMVDVLESKVLPAGFGNKLYTTAFLKQGDESVYTKANEQQQPAQPVDEYTRVSRLEQFFDGISNCGRRGTKAAVKALVKCCEPVTPAGGEESMISAIELVDITYRIALSSAFLATTDKGKDNEEQDEEDNNMLRFLPAEDATSKQVLNSLAHSILNHSKQRRTRQGLPPLPPQAEEKVLVSCDDVIQWVDEVAPLFSSTLSTFTYRIFNPGQPYPPSRTEFVYPIIPEESAFFEAGNSPILFVLACMSTSLGGHVSSLSL